MPLRYGSYKSAWKRLKRWQVEGVWDRILKALASIRGHEVVAVDSTTAEAKRGRVGYDGFKHKKGSKIHACVDRNSMPLSIVVGPGSEHDSKKLTTLIEELTAKLTELYAAYDTEHIRSTLNQMGIQANIPVNPKPKPHNQTYKKMKSTDVAT